MKSRRNLRPAAIAAGSVMLFVLGTVFACSDATTSAPQEEDAWATQAVVTSKVRLQMDLMSDGVPVPDGRQTRRGDAPMRILPSQSATQASLARTASAGPLIRSAIAKNGDTITVGFVPNESGAPMKRMYVFRNGTIALIYNPSYARKGTGWIRTRGAVMLFDKAGKAALKLEVASSSSASLPTAQRRATDLARAPRDFVLAAASMFVARSAFAADVDESSGCFRKFWDYMVSLADVGLAGFVDYILWTPCLETKNPKSPQCVALLGSGVGTLKALTMVMDKYDAYKTCDLNEFKASGTGGGSTLDPKQFIDDPKTTTPTRMTVTEFIAAAEHNGTYACSDDGNYCTYYAE